jgi:hypothetical protein
MMAAGAPEGGPQYSLPSKERPQRGLRIEALLFLDTAGRLRHPVARRSYSAMPRCSVLTTRPAGFR